MKPIQPKRIVAAFAAATLCLAAPILARAGTKVEVTTPLGSFVLEMKNTEAPITVGNFLKYIGDGDYVNSFLHRSIPGFIAQGGGFTIDPDTNLFGLVPKDDPIVNEFSPTRSNLKYTVAMAKVGPEDGGGPDTATSEWFINLADNSSNLDSQNGGFTVFAEVVSGFDVVDAIETLTAINYIGTDFTNLPILPTAVPPTIEADEVVTTSLRVVGDTDGDADIDDFDLLNAISGFTGSLAAGTGNSTIATGDTDGDGDVDDFDLLEMISGFTGSLTPPASAAVPEPGAATLVGLGALALVRRRRR